MLYQELLGELKSCAEKSYADFNKKLLKNDKINVLGVRIPTLRKIAKKYKTNVESILGVPDDYYEVTFVKLTAVSLLPYEEFIKYSDACVNLIDNWATCDCFAPKCIDKHKDEFLPYIEKYLETDKEFYQRFALTTLLHFYVKEDYLQFIVQSVKKADTQNYYYVHMAAAWLIAELLVKHYDCAVKLLEDNTNCEFTDKKTHNKAIQKATESLRLTVEQKTYLKGLKK